MSLPSLRQKTQLVLATFCAGLAAFVLSTPAHAIINAPAPTIVQAFANDSRISSVTATPTSTTLSATTTWTIQFTLGTSFSNGQINISMSGGNDPSASWNLQSATMTGITGATFQGDSFGGNISLSGTLAAGSYTATLSNVTNPSSSGAFRVGLRTSAQGDAPPAEGQMPNQTYASPVFMGTVIAYGTLTKPDGTTAVSNTGVTVRSGDFTFNAMGNADSTGFFAVTPMSGQTVPTSELTFEAFVPFGTTGLLAPEPIKFTFSGTANNLGTVKFREAVKKIEVTGKYSDGTALTTAQVWSNSRSGGFGGGGSLDSTGKLTVSVGGGCYDLGIGPSFNPTTGQQDNVDWIYSAPPTQVCFNSDSSAETKAVSFTVTKATSKVTGTIKLPNGSAVANVRLDCRGSDFTSGNGTNTGNDGSFTINLTAGTYNCSVFTDPSNTTMAKYSAPEMKVTVKDNETVAFGTITMKEKTGVITITVKDTSGAAVKNYQLTAFKAGGEGGKGGGPGEFNQATTGTDGTATLYVTAPGKYNVMPMMGGGPGDSSTTTYIYNGEPVTVDLTTATSTGTASFTVQAANATITLKTVDKDGKAVTEGFGFAQCAKKNAPPGPGNFFGGPLNQGVATIKLALSASTTFSCGTFLPPDSTLQLKEMKDVTIAANGSETANLTLISPDATIVIKVVNNSGATVTEDGIEAFLMKAIEGGGDPGFGGGFSPAQIKNGEATVKVIGGSKYNTGYFLRPDGAAAKKYAFTPPSFKPFLVAANSTTTVTIVLTTTDTSFAGTLLDPSGNKTQGFVHCDVPPTSGSKYDYHFGTEARDGTFTLPLVGDIEYTCSAGVPNFLGEGNKNMPPDEVTIKPTKDKPVTGAVLQFKESDLTVSVTAKLADGSTPQFGFCRAFSPDGGHSGSELFGGSGASIPLTSGKTWYVGCDSYSPGTGEFFRSTEEKVSGATKGTLSLSLTLTKGSFTVPSGTSATYDATSAQTVALPDGASLSIPASALATSGNVTVSMQPQTNLYAVEGYKPTWYGYSLSAATSDGTAITGNFNSAVTLNVPMPPQDVLNELGVDTSGVTFNVYNTSTGLYDSVAATCTVDETAKDTESAGNCTASLTHFSDYAMTANASAASSKGAANILVAPASGSEPIIKLYDVNGTLLKKFTAFAKKLRTTLTAFSADLNGDGTTRIVVVAGTGAAPEVRIFDTSGNLKKKFTAFKKTLKHGLNLAVGDVNGDGKAEIIVSLKTGGSTEVRIYDGNGKLLKKFTAFSKTSKFGVKVLTGDVNGDGTPDIITIADQGAVSLVRVFDSNGKKISQFYAFDKKVKGTYNVASADLNGDGKDEIVVTPAAGTTGKIAIFNGSTGKLVKQFSGFGKKTKIGTTVAVGDTDGDGDAEIVVAAQSKSSPEIRVYDITGTLVKKFDAYAKKVSGGYVLVVDDVTGDAASEIIVAPAIGLAQPVKIFSKDGTLVKSFYGAKKSFKGGFTLGTVR